MYKFAFTYLVKQDKKTWNNFATSLTLLYQNVLNKLSYDIYYINHISFLLDILILFKTIKTVFTAKANKIN